MVRGEDVWGRFRRDVGGLGGQWAGERFGGSRERSGLAVARRGMTVKRMGGRVWYWRDGGTEARGAVCEFQGCQAACQGGQQGGSIWHKGDGRVLLLEVLAGNEGANGAAAARAKSYYYGARQEVRLRGFRR